MDGERSPLKLLEGDGMMYSTLLRSGSEQEMEENSEKKRERAMMEN